MVKSQLTNPVTMKAVLPQMGSAQRQPPAMAQLNSDIRQLVWQCQDQRDVLRPSSIVILENLQPHLESGQRIRLFRDIFKSHLQPPGAPLLADFWTHETFCQLCRRILKAGGAEYVDYVDRIREKINMTAGAPVLRPSYPSSANISMSGFTRPQQDMVKKFRAEGADRASAISHTTAIAALLGTTADGNEFASLMHTGISFEAAIIQIRQRMPDGAPQGHEHEVEDDSEDEDEDGDGGDEDGNKDEDDEDEDGDGEVGEGEGEGEEEEEPEDESDDEEEAESDDGSPIGGEHALDHPRSNNDKDTPIRKPPLWQTPPPTKPGRPKDAASSSVLRGPARMVVHTPHTANSTIQSKQVSNPPGLHDPARAALRILPHLANGTMQPKGATNSSGQPSPARIEPRYPPHGEGSLVPVRPRPSLGRANRFSPYGVED